MHVPQRSRPPSRKTLLKTGVFLCSLVTAGALRETLADRKGQTKQAVIDELFSGVDQPLDTLRTEHDTLLERIVRTHPYLGCKSIAQLSRNARHLQQKLGHPGASIGPSYIPRLMPNVGPNHYNALQKTCYIAQPTLMQWATELPHVYQHNQEGVIVLTADWLLGVLRSVAKGSIYDSTYHITGTLEHHAHEIIEPALIDGLYSKAYGEALLADVRALHPYTRLGYLSTFFEDLYSQNGEHAMGILFKTPAFQLLFAWMADEGRETMQNDMAMVSTNKKSILQKICFQNHFLTEAQRTAWNTALYDSPVYLKTLLSKRTQEYEDGLRGNYYFSRQKLATTVANELDYTKNIPNTHQKIEMRFCSFVKERADLIATNMSLEFKPFIIIGSASEARLLSLFRQGLSEGCTTKQSSLLLFLSQHQE